jgi:hypothetical protein
VNVDSHGLRFKYGDDFSEMLTGQNRRMPLEEFCFALITVRRHDGFDLVER